MDNLTLRLVLVLLVVALTAPAVTAGHCNGPSMTVPVGAYTMYVEQRPEGTSEYRFVVYLESNDVPGLQTGADPGIPEPDPVSQALWFINSDSCAHSAPDTFLFGIPADA